MAADHAHIVRGMHDPSERAPSFAAAEPGARRSIRTLLRGGPLAKEIARADASTTSRGR